MGYTSDLMPHVGQIPGKEAQYILAGFNGHGMPQILLTSKGIADMVLQEITFEETGLPTMFKTTQERLSSNISVLEEGFKEAWQSRQTTAQVKSIHEEPRLQARL